MNTKETPIEEVHFALKETNAGERFWTKPRLPAEHRPLDSAAHRERKTYEDTSSIDPAAAKIECSLKEVVFKDGTTWTAK